MTPSSVRINEASPRPTSSSPSSGPTSTATSAPRSDIEESPRPRTVFHSISPDRDYTVELQGGGESLRCQTPCELDIRPGHHSILLRDQRNGTTTTRLMYLAPSMRVAVSHRSQLPWDLGGAALLAVGLASVGAGIAVDVRRELYGGVNVGPTLALVIPGSIAAISGAALMLVPRLLLSSTTVDVERTAMGGPSRRVILSLTPLMDSGLVLGASGRF